jgi:hypothetical protein
VFLSKSSAQETVLCQFMTEYDAAIKTLTLTLCILGNNGPGHKVAGLSSEGAVHRHHGPQSRIVKFCDSVPLKVKKYRSVAW